jgi:hypothetical protein
VSGYRIGVADDATGGVTLWYDFDNPEDAYSAWRLLRDYARDGIGVTVQHRGPAGQWLTVDPLATGRPLDWPPEE